MGAAKHLPGGGRERPQMLELTKGRQPGPLHSPRRRAERGRDWGWQVYQVSVPLLVFNYHCCRSYTGPFCQLDKQT